MDLAHLILVTPQDDAADTLVSTVLGSGGVPAEPGRVDLPKRHDALTAKFDAPSRILRIDVIDGPILFRNTLSTTPDQEWIRSGLAGFMVLVVGPRDEADVEPDLYGSRETRAVWVTIPLDIYLPPRM
ncbi:hypothetical protein [Streptomyces malaysiensis]|uniref:hypothetical protein n=1 Tax=Streptomyces malaysiensis TaxID=92644 RepID=UPI00142EAB4E|nr:hypothetical protein [Streptomyces malaysiensis]